MTEQPDDSPRRVVKKVVKKTVVRPVSPGPVTSAGSSSGRLASPPPRHPPARLATPARAQGRRSTAPSVATPASVSPVKPAPAAATKPAVVPASVQPAARRPGVPSLSLPRPRIRVRVGNVRHAVGDRVRDGLAGIRHRFEDAWDWLLSLRLPHLSPLRGSAITGVVVGLLSVVIGWGFYEIFSATLGTQAGGGWGFLAFVFLSFVAFIVGELLLAGFAVPHARVVSILSVLLVLLVVLLFFIELAAGIWAWLLVPVLTSLAFIASSWMMAAAAKEQNPQRLPWEPVDESQVKRD